MTRKAKHAWLCATAFSTVASSPGLAQTTPPQSPAPTSPTRAPVPGQAVDPVPPQAPQDDTATDGDIVVTGFRQSLEAGLDIKRESTAIVDSIVAEDIGKFPTQNIAEALQRIPGVDMLRNGESNEGQRIQLRGLGPEFTLTTFNGSPVRTTSSGNIGASTRDFNYDVFSSELFGRADVYKTPLAELEEGGVAGVVNLRTPRPFDRKGLRIGYAASANYSTLSQRVSPRGSIQFSNTWGRVGLSAGFARSGNYNNRFGYEPTGSFNNEFENLLYTSSANFNAARLEELGNIPSVNRAFINSTTGALSFPTPPGNPFNVPGINTFKLDFSDPTANLGGYTRTQLRNALVPRLLRITGTENDRNRIGASGSLQYKDSRADFSFDLLYARLKDDSQRQILGFAPRNSVLSSGLGVSPGVGLASIPASGGDQPAWVPLAPTIDANGLLGGTFKNVAIQNAATYRRSTTKFLSTSLNGRYDFTDSFSVEGQLGRNNSDAVAYNATTTLNGINPLLGAAGVAQNRASLSTVTFNVSDPFKPEVSTTSDLTSPTLYNQIQLTGNKRVENDLQKNARLTLQLKFEDIAGFSGKLRIGGSYVDSVKEGLQPNIGSATGLTGAAADNPLNLVNIGTGGATVLYGAPTTTEAQRTAYIRTIISPIDLSGTRQEGVPSSWLTLDRPYLDSLNFEAALDAATVDRSSSFKATERVKALFAQLDLVRPDVFRANVGVRYVDTRTIIENFQVVAGVPTPQRLNGGYRDWLPSASLAFNITPKLIVRGLYSKTLTRSPLNNIARAVSIPNPGTAFVNLGNPDLRPQRSSGFDGAVEWYFERGGILSVGAFSKSIKDRPATVNSTVTFAELGLDPSLFTSPLNIGQDIAPGTVFTISKPFNQDRYSVKGIELAYQQAFRFLPKPFDGLGAIGSFTFIPTKSAPWYAVDDAARVRPYSLQGIPRYAASGTLYYEKGPLSTRASYTYRSEKFNGDQNNNGLNFQYFENARSYLDATIGYRFTRWLEVRIDGQNLTNTKTYVFARSLTGEFGDEKVRADQAFQSGRTFTFGIRGTF